MAGISAEAIKRELGFDAKVIRVMPNTPLLVGYGSIALSRINLQQQMNLVYQRSVCICRKVEEISPNMKNEVIPLNGTALLIFISLQKCLLTGLSNWV
jgi:pyrroline-5-carboxylate reductase